LGSRGTAVFNGTLEFGGDATTGFYVNLLGLAGDFAGDTYYHFTYDCGNDFMMGHVPIPPTALLLGSGLVGLGLLGRRKKSKR
jgi:hypothetical protein